MARVKREKVRSDFGRYQEHQVHFVNIEISFLKEEQVAPLERIGNLATPSRSATPRRPDWYNEHEQDFEIDQIESNLPGPSQVSEVSRKSSF